MNASNLFPSKWLKAGDVTAETVLTVRSVVMEKVGDGDKPVLHFNEMTKGMVLNVTNGKVLQELYGGDTDFWIGKKVTLYSAMVDAYGEMVPAIRLKAPGRAVAPNGATNGQKAEMTTGGAWAAYKAACDPTMSVDNMKLAFKGDCETYFGVPFDYKRITGQQWAQFVGDGFIKHHELAPAGTAVQTDEIPF